MTEAIGAAMVMREIAGALGLPNECYSIHIELDVDDAARLVVGSFLSLDQWETVKRIITEYELHAVGSLPDRTTTSRDGVARVPHLSAGTLGHAIDVT